ncbi:MAG: hypothetical protein WD403_10280 [Pirellulales bacterium]
MIQRTQLALDRLLAYTLQRDFFGTVRIELAIQNGTIQHIRQGIDQLEK